ncbi:MAG: o-succinylbenzoate synthase [Parachlamydiaceae bacterium]
MKIHTLTHHPYQIPMTTGQVRFGIIVHMIDEEGNESKGEVAPLPQWSRETLAQSIRQLQEKTQAILAVEWTADTCLKELERLDLYPSVTFGVESALLSILAPLPPYQVAVSALLMGSPEKIMEHATLRLSEGYTSAKLKVSQLSFEEAAQVIQLLKDKFYLRIDVNRAWETEDSLRFFSQFPKNTFDYVEEPFKNPKELHGFEHPLAIDESFPQDLSLEDLEGLPLLKAVVYKPTIQGGMLGCLPIHSWAKKRGIALVLSSCFESNIGLEYVASIAQRLSLKAPVGTGTRHYMHSQD